MLVGIVLVSQWGREFRARCDALELGIGAEALAGLNGAANSARAVTCRGGSCCATTMVAGLNGAANSARAVTRCC